jgi:hypothetical protein
MAEEQQNMRIDAPQIAETMLALIGIDEHDVSELGGVEGHCDSVSGLRMVGTGGFDPDTVGLAGAHRGTTRLLRVP